MNTKKYLFFSIFGLIITWVLGYFLLNSRIFSQQQNVLSYLPVEFDQVIYLEADNDLRNLLLNSYSQQIPDSTKTLLSWIDEISVYQYLTWWKTIEFFLVSLNDNFDLDKFLEQNPDFQTQWYVHNVVSDNIIIYWSQESVDFFENYKWSKLTSADKIKPFIDWATWKQYNFLYITIPDKEQIKANFWMFQNYVDKLQYWIFASHVWEDNNYWEIDVIFDDQLKLWENIDFQSKLSKYIDSNTIFFMEIGNLIKDFGISKSQISLWLSAFLNLYFPDMFLQSDYDKVVDAFDGNIAVDIAKADNMLWVGATIIFENQELYDVVNKFFPYLQQTLSSLWWFEVKTFESDNVFWFNLQLPDIYWTWTMQWDISFEKKNDNFILNVLWVNSSNIWDNFGLNYSKKTILTFYMDFSVLAELLNRYSLFFWNVSDFTNELGSFKDKKLYWDLVLDNDRFVFKFETK